MRATLISRQGAMAGIDDSRQFLPLRIAVLTVSDTRELADDKSGAVLTERIKAAGHVVAERTIVPDDVAVIQGRVKEWIEAPAVGVIITTGGNGFTGRHHGAAAQHDDAAAAQAAQQLSFRIGVLAGVAAELLIECLGDQQALLRARPRP